MNLLDCLFTEPIGLFEPSLASILLRHGRIAQFEGIGQFSLADFAVQRRPMSVGPDGVAMIHINGPLAQGLAPIDLQLGATDYDHVIGELSAAGADQAIKGIRLDINSPGGSTVGMEETAQAVAEARAQKPIVASISGMGCSAAYGIACGATAIVASPSAMTGSIGTIGVFRDMTGFLQQFGIKAEVMTSRGSDLKAAGHPLTPMSAEHRDYLQGQLDTLNAGFVQWVQSNRPHVRASSLRGQWFTGRQAVAVGIVDELGSTATAHAAVHQFAALTTK